ncbi:MAG TPA: hypothetical protein VN642_06030 [Dongiaceae bacterium]|nr:hypothetical protein [Dongiaceae bacterium]
MVRLVRGVLCVLCLTLAACASGTGLSEELNRSVKSYNQMLRWHEIENAGMTYIDPDLREEYLKQAETLKKRGLSVTDYRILSTKYLPEKQTGDVLTEFDYYLLPSNRVKTLSYRQEWVYRENSRSWKLKSGLPTFE